MQKISIVSQSVLIIVLLSLQACSPPSKPAIELSKEEIAHERHIQQLHALSYQLKQKIRLAEVSRPILLNSLSQCPNKQQNSLGLILHSIDDYPKKQRKSIQKHFGTDQRLQVLHPIKSSPAEGHLFRGDIIEKINRDSIAEGTSAGLKQLKQALEEGNVVTLGVRRSNKALTVEVKPEAICAYPVILSQSDQINGYADGSNIIITAGLMRFAQQDNELALIIAHELAHNTQQHIKQRLINGALGGLADIALISSGFFSPFVGAGVGANLFSQSYEIEADLLGLQIVHQAGFEIEGLDHFWQKMGALHPGSIIKSQQISHPTTVERALLIRKEIKRIKNQ